MLVLVDTSVWVDYFRSGQNSSDVDVLIQKNLIAINDIILTELVPFLQLKKQSKVIKLLNNIQKYPLQIDWKEIIHYQTTCLKSGIHGIGIPDLLIAQNIKQNNLCIYSLDKHFTHLHKIIGIQVYKKEV